MAVPIFFFATLALVLLLELLSVQTAVRSGLQEAGKKLAVQAVEVPAVIPSNLERDVVNSIGAERLERSIVEGGSSGINCNQSYLIASLRELEKFRHLIRCRFRFRALL